MLCLFITHPEVVIDPLTPIDEWGLSEAGSARASLLPALFPEVALVISSTERKARETAGFLIDALGVEHAVDAELGEIDRSSTGYLAPAEFDVTVDRFFARPEESIRGWERAIDAQRRIEGAVRRSTIGERDGAIAFVAHGGVGALLLASLTGSRIDRDLDQPGMGSYFAFDARAWVALSSWQRIS
ncbi:histidine phosphatase family protein [Clavibacter michiganensis]|uniref:Histidine phosphatase family protein n=1 Tax=Clavibacter michiganensis TaxID=28447 RepID=A0A2S5V8J1_9MICO|nr:histidine phosphatase family protein [Clavibacter michiganensis]PPF55989.1 histidine phosphatase family protein [Clavibacter michiganensis]PPF70996.1 histidine phosphatase family protein [Clavibacter michiganensis]